MKYDNYEHTMTKAEIEEYLEDEACFRDYDIKAINEYELDSKALKLIEPTIYDLESCISSFSSNSYGSIIIYI